MCHICDQNLSRRTVLRRMATGGALAMTAPLWLPGGWAAADDGSSTDDVPPNDGAAGEDSARLVTTTRRRVEAASPISAVGVTRRIPAINLATIAAPPIVTRKEWGADETLRSIDRAFAPIRKLVVHHTASTNRPRSPVSVVRATYEHHVRDRGFVDIGYNYLIDHRGAIYEGRYSRRFGSEPISAEDQKGWGVIGAHSARMNAGTCGVCLIGNFETESPTDAAISSLVWLMAWKAGRHRIDVLDSDPHANAFAEFFQYDNLSGHRNVGYTVCPGARLYKRLPAVRTEVANRAGRWDPLIIDTPGLIRYESGLNGQGPLDATSSAAGSGSSAAGGNVGTGTKVIGYRAISTTGLVMNTSKAPKHGGPGVNVAAMSSPPRGSGYAVVGTDGKVFTFGGLPHAGDAAGKGTAVDIASTTSGAGYWVLMADGGIHPFGDARYHSSPRRAGVAAGALKMTARPQGDGYWVLTADGKVRGFGAVGSLGSPSGGATPVDVAATPSGKGYLVLLEDGEVAAFGDAVAKGGISSVTRRWPAPARSITTLSSGSGYVISSKDGGLFSFGGAPFLGSFAGSGTTVASIVVAHG